MNSGPSCPLPNKETRTPPRHCDSTEMLNALVKSGSGPISKTDRSLCCWGGRLTFSRSSVVLLRCGCLLCSWSAGMLGCLFPSAVTNRSEVAGTREFGLSKFLHLFHLFPPTNFAKPLANGRVPRYVSTLRWCAH